MKSKFKQLASNLIQKEAIQNEINMTLESSATFSIKSYSGLNLKLYGGKYASRDGLEIIDFNNEISIVLNDNSINYVEYNIDLKQITFNNIDFTIACVPLYKITTNSGQIIEDEIENFKIVKFQEKGTSPGNSYVLPIASQTTLGGVKVDGITTSIDENGVLSVINSSNNLRALTEENSGSLIVNKDGNLFNNNVTIMNFKDYDDVSVSSTDNTIIFDDILSIENIISGFKTSTNSGATAIIVGSYTGTVNNVNSTPTSESFWSSHYRKSLLTAATNLSTSRYCSNIPLSFRSIYTRTFMKQKFGGYIGTNEVTLTSFFVGMLNIDSTTTASQTPFSNNYASSYENGMLGVGWRSTDTNLQLIYHNDLNVIQFVDTGFLRPDNNNRHLCFELNIDISYSSTQATISVKNLNNNAIFKRLVYIYNPLNHKFYQTVLHLCNQTNVACSINYENQTVYSKSKI